MFIHEKLMLCALDLLNEYHLEPIDIVGELCQAGHTLSAFSNDGLRKLHEELQERSKPVAEVDTIRNALESRDEV